MKFLVGAFCVGIGLYIGTALATLDIFVPPLALSETQISAAEDRLTVDSAQQTKIFPDFQVQQAGSLQLTGGINAL